jgi:hypothetical protein
VQLVEIMSADSDVLEEDESGGACSTKGERGTRIDHWRKARGKDTTRKTKT